MKTTNLAWSLLLLPLLAGCPTRYVGGDEDGGTGSGAGSESKGGHAGSAAGSSGAGGKGNATGGAAGTSATGAGGVSTGGALGSGGSAGSTAIGTGGGAGHGSGGAGTGGAAGSAGHGSGGVIGSGGMGGRGGSVGTGGAGTGGTGTGGKGTGDLATGGAAGSPTGAAGAGGAPACTNLVSDPANCGTCGHSCLGGTCAQSTCQPFLLGSVPTTTEYAHQVTLSGGQVYVFTAVGQNQPSNVWRTDANTPGTPTEVTTDGTVSCLMNGTLFWITYSQSTYGIASCTVSNCAATTSPVLKLNSGDFFGVPPGCDSNNNELVWTTTSDFINYKVSRASATGTNSRTITTFYLADNYWKVVGSGTLLGDTSRIFFDHFDTAASTDSLYYVSTSILNSSSVQIGTVSNVALTPTMASAPVYLANGSYFLAPEYSTAGNFSTVRIALPNGVLSGSPPVFANGYIYGGVLDGTSFYGTIWSNPSIPQDAVISCPISDCSSPTILARGQSMPATFASDSSALYWTTSGQGGNIAVWKLAK